MSAPGTNNSGGNKPLNIADKSGGGGCVCWCCCSGLDDGDDSECVFVTEEFEDGLLLLLFVLDC